MTEPTTTDSQAAKSDELLAYEAGRHAADDPYARRHALDACPFAEGSERDAWIKGLDDALSEQVSVENVRAAIKEARDDAR